MEAYHHMLVHFPLALWATAAIAMVISAVSSAAFAMKVTRTLVPLLWLGNLFAVFAYGSGMLVWDPDAIVHSPMGRNHILMSTWTFAFWIAVTLLLPRVTAAAWESRTRWLMVLLAILGTGFLAVTGTLGGHLTGSSTALSELLRFLGWEVYTTFYLPLWMIAVTALAGLILAGIGLTARAGRG